MPILGTTLNHDTLALIARVRNRGNAKTDDEGILKLLIDETTEVKGAAVVAAGVTETTTAMTATTTATATATTATATTTTTTTTGAGAATAGAGAGETATGAGAAEEGEGEEEEEEEEASSHLEHAYAPGHPSGEGCNNFVGAVEGSA